MLIVIASDPRTSHRPAEAIRVAAGLAALGSIPIDVCFCGAAALVLSNGCDRFVEGDLIEKNLDLLEAHANGIWAETGDPFLAGTERISFKRIGLTELSQLVNQQAQVIRF